MTINGLHAINPAMKLKLLAIPNINKQKTNPPRIKMLFLFLNKSRNLCSWDESFFLLVTSIKGIRRISNHFLKAFMVFILNRRFHIPFLADLSKEIITFFSIKYQQPYFLKGYQIFSNFERSFWEHLIPGSNPAALSVILKFPTPRFFYGSEGWLE